MLNLLQQSVRPGVEWIMRRSLRQAFSQVAWVGPSPELPGATPIVCYANHHTFHDGYLLWLLVTRHLGRPGVLWMRDWDQLPFFGAAGALPFPRDDAARRARTIRATARFFEKHPDGVLVLFPEGTLHPPEEGIAQFSTGALARLGRVLPPHVWWPVAMHVSWREAPRPVALLAGGEPQESIAGDECERLGALWHRLRREAHEPSHVLLQGRRPLGLRWDMTPLRALFDRYP